MVDILDARPCCAVEQGRAMNALAQRVLPRWGRHSWHMAGSTICVLMSLAVSDAE